MARRVILLAVLVIFLAFAAGTAPAQSVDARSALEAAAKAMGGTNLKTIRYSANGWSSRIGQTYGLAEDWPHYEVADYTRAIDYDAKWSREDYTRRQGKYPTARQAAHAGRAHHLHSERQLCLGHARATSQCRSRSLYLDGVSYADLRQLELAITPHGFLKAALAAKDATAITLPIVGSSDAGLSQNRAQSDDRLLHDREVPRQRNHQRPESGGADGHLVSQSRLWRHGLRDALHEVQEFRRRRVPDFAACAPGRSET